MIITDPIYLPYPSTTIQLSDNMIVFNNGNKWKVIPLDIMKQFPLVYDKVYDKIIGSDSITTDITISFCPISYTTIIYEGNWTISDIKNNNIVIKNKKTNKTINQHPTTISSIRKWEANIFPLRYVLSDHPDCEHLHFDLNKTNSPKFNIKNYKYLEQKLTDSITNSVIDPKTLIYGLIYKSSKLPDYKYMALVPSDHTAKTVISPKLFKYLDSNEQQIREKGGFIVPCLWFVWISLHPTTKIVKI
jgi:hypothetical protein